MVVVSMVVDVVVDCIGDVLRRLKYALRLLLWSGIQERFLFDLLMALLFGRTHCLLSLRVRYLIC